MLVYYRLEGRCVVPMYDLDEWAKWCQQNRAQQTIARHYIDGYLVSTIFLTLDFAHGLGRPLFFETMVFKGVQSLQQQRYSTYDEAEAGHKAILRDLLKSNRLLTMVVNNKESIDDNG